MESNNGVCCVSSLWEEYNKTKDIVLRNKLIEEYLHLVKYAARKIKRKCPNDVEFDDLVSAGVFGLIYAIESFDFYLGIKFETYCARRIIGAILDEMRSMDWVPRWTRLYIRRYELAVKTLSNGKKHLPTSQEIADYFGITIEEAEKIKIQGSAAVIKIQRITDAPLITTDKFNGRRLYGNYFLDLSDIVDLKNPEPDKELITEDSFQFLISFIPIREKKILELYYKDGYKTAGIGKMLGLSKTSISDILSSAIEEIKGFLLINKKWVKDNQ